MKSLKKGSTGARALKPRAPNERAALVIPRWEPHLRVLSLGARVVKRFRHRSPRQELILTTFEELRWPTYVDSPFPKSAEDALRNAVKKLNHQETQLIHFRVDGCATGVIWELSRRRRRKQK